MQLLINEVINLDQRLARVLYLHGDMVVMFCIDFKKGEMPFSILKSNLEQKFIDGTASRATDPYLVELMPISEKQDKIAIERWKKIEPIASSSDCFFSDRRGKLIQQLHKETGTQTKYLYKYLKYYWARGQVINALKSNFNNCGAPGKRKTHSSPKGRRRKELIKGQDPGRAPLLTDEILKIFRLVTDKYLLTKNKPTFGYCVRRVQHLFVQLYPDSPEEALPTATQYKYFLEQEVSSVEKLRKTKSAPDYINNFAPISGSLTEAALGPGSIYEIDATIADIYLISERDPSVIIGRPTLYLLIDRFSRMTVGFYVGLENPSYVTAMRAFQTINMDWEKYSEQIGLKFNERYFHKGGLPETLLADRGELRSYQRDLLCRMNGIKIKLAPPYRAISKAIVERKFRTLQAEFKPYSPGVVQGVTIKKRGGRDYRLDATLNLNEFRQIIFTSIIRYNNIDIIKGYDREPDMPSTLPAIPIELWKWGLENRTGRLRQPQSQYFNISLLPQQKVTLTLQGASIFGVPYTCKELYSAGWLHKSKAVNKPKNLHAAYDPANANKIYLIVNSKTREIWECKLASHAREFEGCSFYDVFLIQEERKKVDASRRIGQNKARRETESFVDDLIESAEKRKRKLPKQTKSERTKGIARNKQEEIDDAKRIPLVQTQRESPSTESQIYEQTHTFSEDDFSVPEALDDYFDED